MFTQRTVTVITAATSQVNLARCVRSVQEQTFAQTEHLIIVDGPERREKVEAAISSLPGPRKTRHVWTLPEVTGRDNWNSHRIYAAGSFVCNTEYVCFLDEDNWLEPDHVATMIEAMEAAKVVWGFSLRRIVNGAGDLIALDECESLGNLHAAAQGDEVFHVDANCYMLKREMAVLCAPTWYAPAHVAGQIEPDTVICHLLLKLFPKPATNLRHTVNYTVGNRPESLKGEFFLEGNARMRQRYPNGMPWKRAEAAEEAEEVRK